MHFVAVSLFLLGGILFFTNICKMGVNTYTKYADTIDKESSILKEEIHKEMWVCTRT